jgi:hypothetical protein
VFLRRVQTLHSIEFTHLQQFSLDPTIEAKNVQLNLTQIKHYHKSSNLTYLQRFPPDSIHEQSIEDGQISDHATIPISTRFICMIEAVKSYIHS